MDTEQQQRKQGKNRAEAMERVIKILRPMDAPTRNLVVQAAIAILELENPY